MRYLWSLQRIGVDLTVVAHLLCVHSEVSVEPAEVWHGFDSKSPLEVCPQ